MIEESRRFIYKITVVGEGSVGKTSIILKYTSDSFKQKYIMTIGANFSTYDCKYQGRDIRLIIWDLAGQDQFAALRPTFYKNCRASIIVCSLEKNEFGQDSFTKIPFWHQDIVKNCGDVPILLCANKSDLLTPEDIDHKKIQAIVEKEKFLGYHITSAKTGEGLQDTFTAIIQQLCR